MADVDEKRVMSAETTGRVLHSPALYDLLAWVFLRGREAAFRQQLVDLARLREGESVLDVGCGTGTLAVAAKRRVGPNGAVHGVDASPKMIGRATKKARTHGVEVVFRTAVVETLPYPDAQFDVVLSTLMLHHLPRKAREQCAREMRRVLKPGGRILAVDFGESQQRKGFLSHLHRHGHVPLGAMIELLRDAGFSVIDGGAMGIKGLAFALANVSDNAGDLNPRPIARADEDAPRPRAGIWMASAVTAIVVGHGLLLYYGSLHLALPVAALLSLALLAIVKHWGLLGSPIGLVRRRATHPSRRNTFRLPFS